MTMRAESRSLRKDLISSIEVSSSRFLPLHVRGSDEVSRALIGAHEDSGTDGDSERVDLGGEKILMRQSSHCGRYAS